MKKNFLCLLTIALVAMLSVSLSSCKNDEGIVEGATILGEWVHVYTEFDNDDLPETGNSTFTFDPKTGVLKMPGLTYRDIKVATLTETKLKLKYFPDDDEATTFSRK